MGTVSEHPYDEAVQVLLVTSVEVTMVVRLRSSTLTLATMPAMDHVTGSVSPGAYSESSLGEMTLTYERMVKVDESSVTSSSSSPLVEVIRRKYSSLSMPLLLGTFHTTALPVAALAMVTFEPNRPVLTASIFMGAVVPRRVQLMLSGVPWYTEDGGLISVTERLISKGALYATTSEYVVDWILMA